VRSPQSLTADGRLAIAYVVSQYPAISHVFIQREVRALRALGLRIETFTIRRGEGHSLIDREERRRTTSILPATMTKLGRAHIQAALRSPVAYVATLSFAVSRGSCNPRRTLWQMFYFAEAIILWAHCERRRIRHVHAHFANAGADVARLTATFGRRSGESWTWSFTMHGSAEFLDMRRFGLASKVKDASFVVCISDYCKSQLMWLTDPSGWWRLSVIHCGVEPSVPVQETHDRPISGRPLRVLTIGRLIPLKGQAVLIDAGRVLRTRGVDVDIRVIGGGPFLPVLFDRARLSGMEHSTHFLGAIGQDGMEEHFQWADVFCLPSMMEGLPVVLMEAMVRGVPVVATAITGVLELVTDNRDGLLVRPGRADLLADALERLAADTTMRERLSRDGRARVVNDFNLSTSATQLKRLFEGQAATPIQDQVSHRAMSSKPSLD